MQLKKNLISREDAIKISADYVAFAEGDFSKFSVVDAAFSQLRRGDRVLTYLDGLWVLGTVTTINHNTPAAIDGPVVRVGNGEYTWRCDGDHYGWPIKTVV